MRLVTQPRYSRSHSWLDNGLDNLVEGFFNPVRLVADTENSRLVPTVDVSETDDEFVVRAEIPGVRMEDVSVTVENGVLTIIAESKSDSEKKEGEHLIRRERRFGKYVRSLQLGVDIDESGVKASHKDGLLQVTLPKAEAVKPKQISIDVG